MSSRDDDLRSRLADPSPEVRRRAVADLGLLPLEGLVDQVLAALGDRDWRVRKEMVVRLVRSPSGAALTHALIEAAVQVDDIALRNAAAAALADLGEPAVSGLAERLTGLDRDGRIIACEVIGRSRDARAAGMLAAALDDTDPGVRVCAAEWLGEHGGEEARAALMRCLPGADPLLALAALQSLNGMGARLPCAALRALLHEPLLSAELVVAHGRCGEPAAAALIASRLSREPAAARALEQLSDESPAAAAEVERVLSAAAEEDLAALEPLARDGEPADQRAALRCLMWSRRASFVPLFVELARDENLHPVLLAGLDRWGPAAETALEELLPRVERRDLASAIGLLARLMRPDPDRNETDRFSGYLGSDDPIVATAAAGVMARFGDSRAVPRLLELAGHELARVRRSAGHALVEIGRREPAAVRRAVIVMGLEDERGVELCRVLEVVGRAEDVPLLTAALGSPHPRLRRAVIGALATLAGEQAVETISMAMTDEELEVRMAAAETIVAGLDAAAGSLRPVLIRALGRVGHPRAPAILRGLCRGGAAEAVAALEAMERLGLMPPEIGDDVLNHPDAEVVKRALGSLGAAVTGDRLTALLEHPAWDVRLAAVERIAGSPPEQRTLDALRDRRRREDDDLVRRAIDRLLAAGPAGMGGG